MSKPGDDDALAGLLKAREVAATFGIDPRTLWNWERDEILVPATRVRGHRYYRREDVARLISQGRRKSP
ncbi:MerR family transcriptional regulator [Roseomonas sp. JC162]|uniref:MerR family transcriptional regulator n=1 Tax=Neoroseomonas marina TaxID=1232220 RepID=A0A848EGD5_9PROT|nr:MerR family transcriptional regulator [Neoroseomonas marina]NMJ42465.1 MerR family transcriptional regulator [Neoroseomonas marina]